MASIVLSEGTNILDVQMVPIPEVANLYGVVTDAETGFPISGVKVTLDGLVAYTDSGGAYAFVGLSPGGYTITFEKEGYQPLV